MSNSIRRSFCRLVSNRILQQNTRSACNSNVAISSSRNSCRQYATSAGTTVRPGEKEKFQSAGSDWWNPDGPYKLLHSMNTLRVPFITDGLANAGVIPHEDRPKPLKDLLVLDIGCGGGILSEPLARLGASVTAIDINDEGLAVARGRKGQLDIDYQCTTIEDLAKQPGSIEKFDAVVASEVVEHVADLELFVSQAVSVLKPGGSIYFTTINRTSASRFAAIFAAEYLLCLVPKGTHNWDNFVTPDELQRVLSDCNVETRRINGTFYDPVTDTWKWTTTADILYSLHGIKYKED